MAIFQKVQCVERGTLFQVKNLLYQSSVPADPGDDRKAAKDFLLVVLHSYIVAAAKLVFIS